MRSRVEGWCVSVTWRAAAATGAGIHVTNLPLVSWPRKTGEPESWRSCSQILLLKKVDPGGSGLNPSEYNGDSAGSPLRGAHSPGFWEWEWLVPLRWSLSGNYLPLKRATEGLLWWLSGKEFTCQCKRCRFDPWVRKIPWRRKRQPTPVFLPGKSHGQRSLAGYSPWSLKRTRHD